MEFAVEARSAGVKKFLEAVMPSIVDQLQLTNSRRAVLIKVTKDCGDSDELSGSTLHIAAADCYLVLIKEPRRNTKAALVEMVTTLSHEMVHVRQLAKGLLKYLPKNKKMWKGELYSAKTPYLDQPWELDAFAKQEIICRRAML